MPREIETVRQHGPKWYRIDKGDGSIMEVGSVAVWRAANGVFKKPNHAIASGRFATNFAYYSDEFNLSVEEHAECERATAKAVL